MPVTSRTPVRPPPARARTLCPPLPDPLGRCANPAARGAPPPGGPSQGERTPTSLDHMGCGGRVDRGRGRRGELAAAPHWGRGEDAPHPSSSASPFKFPGPGRQDPGWQQPPARLCALFPATAQKFRSRTSGSNPNPGAPRAAAETPQDRGASGLRRLSRTNTSHKFYFPFALEVLSGSRSAPARLARLPALTRQRYESLPGKGYFGTLRKLSRFQWIRIQWNTLNPKTVPNPLWVFEKWTIRKIPTSTKPPFTETALFMPPQTTEPRRRLGHFCLWSFENICTRMMKPSVTGARKSRRF
nr:uncharacterized protein LOC132414233 [Delphinus delphis]